MINYFSPNIFTYSVFPLRIHLTKEVQHLYYENYKALLKEIGDINKLKLPNAHGLENLDINLSQIDLHIQCNPNQ